jgi:tetratricopeptide (TPR) repeat protein
MYCKHCGKQIDNDSIFCAFCGGAINAIYTFKEQMTSDKSETSPRSGKVNLSFDESTKPQEERQSYENISIEKKYDPYFKKDNDAIFCGIVSMLVVIAFNIYLLFLEENRQEIAAIGNIVILFWRIIAVDWCIRIAKSHNRSPDWGWLAFFFPGITLILLGASKKLLYPINYKRMNMDTQSYINQNIADLFFTCTDYKTAIYFTNKAINLDSKNHRAYFTRGHSKYYLKDYLGALDDFNTSILMDSDDSHGWKYNHRGYAKMELGDLKGAFEDWQTALSKGYSNAQQPIDKYCSNFKQT